jgi:CDP-diacylglycerol--glycerol-3-phosphate 3-phosphatidyltransferase/cardiolipin synthase
MPGGATAALRGSLALNDKRGKHRTWFRQTERADPPLAVAALLWQAALAVLLLPNILTLSRIFAVPLLVALLWPAEQGHEWRIGYIAAFGLYCLMGITDYFDGYLARAQGTVSKLGVFLDPIADKIMVGAVILILCATGDIQGAHIVAALVILLREIAVSGLREFLAGLRISMPVSQLAKWKTAIQLVALGALILAGGLPQWPVVKLIGLVTLWGAAGLTLLTGWDYLRVGLKHMNE